MPDLYRVHVACNNPNNGLFAGEAEQFEFQSSDQEVTVTSARGPVSVAFENGALIVAGERYDILGAPRKWEGNWCWDAVSVTLKDARRLLRRLLSVGFYPEEWQTDGPFSDLVDEALSKEAERD